MIAKKAKIPYVYEPKTRTMTRQPAIEPVSGVGLGTLYVNVYALLRGDLR